jgi:hypothetical protein
MKETYARLAILATILLIPGLILGYQHVYLPARQAGGVKVFQLTAMGDGVGAFTLEQVNGLNYWWKSFPPAIIFLEAGDRALIRLQSGDVSHRFYVPALRLGPVDVRPGHPAEISFTALQPGSYQYFCTTICGPCHFYMTGWIVVSVPGAGPEIPPPLNCPLCPGDFDQPPPTGMTELGEYLYWRKGCVTCHGLNGAGGVANYNYAKNTIPAHNRTAEKLFLRSREEADAFVKILAGHADPEELAEPPEEIMLYPVVRDRYQALQEIIRNGSRPERLDPGGPEPPYRMPAWKYLLAAHEIKGLIAYFISLQPWEEEPEAEP